MKANRGQIERALDNPTADVRLFLLHGPDDAGSRALAERLERAMGADAERIDLDTGTLKGDPALLADEAASISLFGGARHIRIVTSAGEELMASVEALISAPAAGNPAVVIAGALRATSPLLKLALAEPTIMTFASYAPEGQDADRLATALAREAGLRLASPDVAKRLSGAAAGNRAILSQEIEKLALYLDAAPERPCELDHHALDALGADWEGGDTARLVDAVAGGNPAALANEIARLTSVGVDGIPLLRAIVRRILLLIQLRSEMAEGSSIDAVMAASGKSLFWKDKPSVQRQLGLWSPDKLATALSRLLDAERAIKTSGAAGSVMAENELLAIARAAARGR